jgi:hypothetical protein
MNADKKLFLINFPSVSEENFYYYFDTLVGNFVQNPIDYVSFVGQNCLSGFTITFNLEYFLKKFKNSFFIYYKEDPNNLYDQYILIKNLCPALFHQRLLDDFTRKLNIDLLHIPKKDYFINNVNSFYDNLDNIVKDNPNVLNFGEINNSENFFLNETKIYDFLYTNHILKDLNSFDFYKNKYESNEILFRNKFDFESLLYNGISPLRMAYPKNSFLLEENAKLLYNDNSYSENLILSIENEHHFN